MDRNLCSKIKKTFSSFAHHRNCHVKRYDGYPGLCCWQLSWVINNICLSSCNSLIALLSWKWSSYQCLLSYLIIKIITNVIRVCHFQEKLSLVTIVNWSRWHYQDDFLILIMGMSRPPSILLYLPQVFMPFTRCLWGPILPHCFQDFIDHHLNWFSERRSKEFHWSFNRQYDCNH